MKKLLFLISVVGLFALTWCATTTTNPIQNVPAQPAPSQPILSQPTSPQPTPSQPAWPVSGPKACTMEAKLCPDGSAVGRTGPNCEFAPCPGEGQGVCTTTCTCPAWYRQDGQACNPSCYYSTPRCMIASRECQPTTTCTQK